MSLVFVQSEGTAARRRFPVYLVDATDGITPETGEGSGQPQISKNGGAFANTSATLTAVANGAYYVELTAGELDTLGTIIVRFKSANTAEFNMHATVVAANVHDSVRLGLTALPNAAAESAGGLFTRGTGAGQINQDNNGEIDVDAVRINGNNFGAIRLERWMDAGNHGTAQAGTASTITLDAGASGTDDIYNGMLVCLSFGTGDLQARVITDYVGSTKVATVAPNWVTNPDATSVYSVVPVASRGLNRDISNFDQFSLDANGRVDVGALVGTAQSATDLKDFADEGYDPATNKVQGVVLVDTLTTYTGNTPQTGDNFARLGAPVGASVSADIAAIQSDTDDIQLRIPSALTSGTADSGTTTTMVDAARTEADTDYWKGSWIRFTSGNISGQTRLITAFTPATDTITFTPATTQAVATQDYEILPAGAVDLGLWLASAPNALVSGRVDADVGAITGTGVIVAATFGAGAIDSAAVATDAIGSAELDTSAVNEIRDAILSDSTAFAGANIDAAISSRATPAQVNTEVLDVLNVDTFSLPGQAAPPLTPTLVQALTWLFKVLRNRTDQTSTLWQLYADNETTVDAKATVSDDGTTAVKQEIVSGP